ncbi:hypothetical protein GCM10028805_13340 [Spirosoma harenae]
MSNRYFLVHLLVFGWVAINTWVSAQSTNQVLKITYPSTRAVFQRTNDNNSTIYLSGSLYQPVDSVQARIQAEVDGQGLNTNWVTIQKNPQGGIFQGSIRGKGGWYRLEVQAFAGGSVIGSDVVRKVGIGEVFIITGQSNAQGFQQYGATGATDDRVNCVVYDNSTANSLADPPAPTFQQLTATSVIGPRGQSAWCWGYLGDLLVKQFNVPVLFINTAWAGTVIQNWTDSADGKVAKNIFAIGTPNENFPAGMPYANLRISLRYYSSLQGLRAVLWQQGENDNSPLHTPRKEYASAMQYLVNKTRSDTERYPAWVLARSSYNTNSVSQDIIQAQNDVINTYANNVFAGPFTDNIQIPRFDEVHFGNRPTNNPGDKGLNDLGQAWYESLNAVFFASSLPLTPSLQPTLSVACATNGSNLTLSLPNLYRSYSWSSGQSTQSITVNQSGSYRATLKDAYGNTYLSPAIEIQGSIQPPTPTISLAKQPTQTAANQQQICADSTLALIANTAANSTGVWSQSTTTTIAKTINLAKAGTYSLQAVSVYGCKSAQSASINLTVRQKVPTPSIEQIGPYSLQAVLPTPTGGQPDLYDWQRNSSELLPRNSAVIKVVVSANYSARTKTTFSLTGATDITCYSTYSTPKPFTFDRSNGGLVIYPNPSSDGVVAIETVEDLKDADIDVFTLTGQKLFSSQVTLLDQRQVVDLTGLAQGVYLVRVHSAGFDVSKRVIINR